MSAEKWVEKAKELKRDIPAVFLALKDARTPVSAKLLAALTVAYALSPVDLIPDFIPVLGYLDDLIILPALVALCMQLIPAPVWKESQERAADIWADGKPKKWYFAVPIILLWLLIIYLLIKAIWL